MPAIRGFRPLVLIGGGIPLDHVASEPAAQALDLALGHVPLQHVGRPSVAERVGE